MSGSGIQNGNTPFRLLYCPCKGERSSGFYAEWTGTADPKTKISYDRPQQENSQITIDREILRTKSGQNLLGPR